MSTRESFQDGQSLGYEFAHAEYGYANFARGCMADELRAEAIEARADSPSWRAFKLGIVRAYRDATRTLRGGRWGT
jgi:hypothetical protein